MGLRPLLLALLVSVAGPVVLAAPASAAPAPVVAPSVTGTPEYAAVLAADPGQWAPAAASYAYQWLRDGQPVAGATAPAYRAGLDDIGHTLAVTVTATDGLGESGTATSTPTSPVREATLVARRGQKIAGEARWTQTMVARPGTFSTPPDEVGYQWLRSRTPIAGATGRRYEVRPEDVGTRLRVRLRATAPGYRPLVLVTAPTPVVRHRVDVRRTVRYHVETRGHLTTSLRQFRAQAQETFDDPRGWRGSGIRFVPVRGGGALTLVLAEASWLPRFSSGCSAMWSCRVGRYVIINQERWKHASPAWNAAHLPLRSYRHMVVNHETGHWLGLGHARCPGPGRLAPVMQQQSKGLQGCRFNPFPTERELAGRTPRGPAVARPMGQGYSPDVE